MSRERTSMSRLLEMVRLHRLGTSSRKVAKLLKMGPNTERQYRKAFVAEGLLEGDAEALPSIEALKAAVEKHYPKKMGRQQESSVMRWRKEVEKKLSKGAGPQSIFDYLRLEHKDFEGSLWAVKRLCRRIEKAKPVSPEDVAIPVETSPGDVLQVDFGYVGKLFDTVEQVLRKAWVFVAVLGFSRHMFCRTVFDQKASTWLRLHIETFETFGGVPETVVPDNLKSAVIRAAFGVNEEPALHRSYRELAGHYGFKIDPTPPRAPEKKGKVESGVKYVKRNFFKPRELEDIDQANRDLDRWVEEIAGKRIHGTTGKRPLEIFETEERSTLNLLPAQKYELVVWKQATVHRDCRLLFEKLLYPVPWRFIGKKVWVRATQVSVEIYCDDVRIASHQRGVKVPSDVLDTYLPPKRSDLRHRSREYWVERADVMGEAVGKYIREVFDSDDVLSMLRSVQAMVTLLETHPRKRARAACERASYFGNFKYHALRNILRKGLDLEPLPTVVLNEKHGVLDKPRFARSAKEMLQLPLEVINEPN